MSFLNGLLDTIIPLVIGLRATEYTIVACAGLLTYEYFLTLDREIFYVWGSQWSLGKVLFFLNRYSPFVDTTLSLLVLFGVKDPSICPSLARATAWAFVSGMFISEIILAMRTYAIWGGRRSMLVFLVILTVSIFTGASILTQQFLNSLTFVVIPPFIQSLGIGVTCAPLPANGRTSFLEFIVFMINQAVIAILTLYRGLHQYRVSRHPVIRTMFQDGLLYYLYTLVLSVANTVMAIAAPAQYGLLLELPLRVVISICCTRVLLNIRGAYFNPTGTSHNGVILYPKGGPKWGLSSDAGGTDTGTGLLSESGYLEETNGANGWTWQDARSNSPPALALRPISPFECDPPNME